MIKRALRFAAIVAGVALVSVMAQGLAAAAGTSDAPTVAAGPIRLTAVRSAASMPAPARRRPVAVSVPVATTVPAPAVAAVAVAAVAVPAVAPAPAPAGAPPTIAGQEATLVIASIGLRQPVAFGGQATIDRGLVTHFQGPGWRPAVAAGAPGTYWLAAHHVTHGAPFGVLPNIRVGAIIAIDPVGGAEIRYQVTSVQVVGTTASFLTVYGPDTTTSRILLQTCEGGANRILVHGVRVA